ncbi:hypothetical protein TNCV_4050541 [Trichonephila clavipes]|nr:hypothetical protein TNCV_4050541 [Trichonephila clavipes]
MYETKTDIGVVVVSNILGRGGHSGMIYGDADDFGITAIPGNRGNRQFDGHWLAIEVDLVDEFAQVGVVNGSAQVDLVDESAQVVESSAQVNWICTCGSGKRICTGHRVISSGVSGRGSRMDSG